MDGRGPIGSDVPIRGRVGASQAETRCWRPVECQLGPSKDYISLRG